MAGIVVMHLDEDGHMRILTTADVVVYTIDEQSPSDRVYRHALSDDAHEIANLIGRDPIGHIDDGKSGAVRKAINQIN